MNISLINEYKIPFIIHRIFKTFFGGLEISNGSFGWKSSSNQDSPNVGANTLQVVSSTAGSSANASILKLFIYLFPSSIGLISSILIDHRLVDSYIGTLTTSLIGFLFTLVMNIMPQISLPGSNKTSPLWSASLISAKQQTMLPIVIRYHSTVFILARSLVSSSMLGIMINTFKHKQIKTYIQTGNLLTLCILVLVWFTFTTAHYSLIVGSPPETTTYSIRFHQIDCLNRSIYLMILLIMMTFISSHTYTICTLIICCLPFLWLFGFLPPITALGYYLLEQINIIILAGTAGCFVWSLFMTISFCLLVICLSHFYLDSNQFILVNLMASFLISNKWLFNLNQLQEWIYLIKMLISIALIIAINLIEIDQHNHDQIFHSFWIILSTIYLVKYFKIINLFNLVKNPLCLIMSNVFLNRIHSNRLFIMLVRLMLHICIPILCLVMIIHQLNRDRINQRTAGQFNMEHFILNLLVFRMFRQCWQCPQSMSLEIIIIQIIDEHLKYRYFASQWPLEIKYLTLDLMYIFLVDFSQKIYLIFTILGTSVLLRKQKVKYSWTIFVFNVIFLPVNLSIAIMSSILSAPILPLFTLPIFLLSFPRPLKFWSTTPMNATLNDVNDAVYYKQVMPRLIDSLHKKSLFWDFRRAGEILIARFDDRLMWFQVLESGHNYVQVQMKGLELQETSCHTIEASTIDQIIEQSFNCLGLLCGNLINKYLFYAIKPIMKVETKTYSDAKSVLTGVIDSPETYAKIKKLFCQVFIWNLLQRKINFTLEQRKNNSNDTSVMVKQSQINVVVHNENKDDQTPCSPLNTETNPNQFTYDDLQPDVKWSNVSYQYSRRKSINHAVNQFMHSIEWFRQLIKVLTNNQENLNDNELQSLTITYNHITNVCFSIIFPVTDIEASTAQNIYELFNGLIIKDLADEKIFFLNPDLHQVCVKSFQYTTKIAFDQMIFSDDKLSSDDLIAILQDFDKNWHFGTSNSNEWKESVLREKLYLFSISKDLVKENYQSHLLTLKNTDVYLCSLNRVIVEAIWSSLSFELFYLTNDDEERYSIQAHQIIFRNLTVQAADPPLGYPVYASEPVIINHIT